MPDIQPKIQDQAMPAPTIEHDLEAATVKLGYSFRDEKNPHLCARVEIELDPEEAEAHAYRILDAAAAIRQYAAAQRVLTTGKP